nr:hypothetical protein [uncultured Marinifilum sp.]
MDAYLKIFTCKLTVYTLVVILLIILSIWIFGSDNQLLLVAISIGTSVYASFLVGAFFQNLMKEDFSKEHFAIMQHKDAFNDSGIIKYYGNFKLATYDLKKSIQNSQKVTIYFTYGYSLLNSLSEEINSLLRKKDAEINVFMLSKKNPFIDNLSDLWKLKVKSKITESQEILDHKVSELKKRGELNGKLNKYQILKYPINYSFYICDDVIYFSPSKMYESKEWVPLVIKAQKTINKEGIYNKILGEFDLMRKSNGGIDKI